ncbi:MAG: hypothetical protein ABI175_17675 [Polyangiales bacterium]
MTISFNGAWVRVGSVSCLVVSVRPRIFEDAYECDLVRLALELRFRVPIVVMTQDDGATPKFRGRPGLVAALRRVGVTALPWRRIHPGEHAP